MAAERPACGSTDLLAHTLGEQGDSRSLLSPAWQASEERGEGWLASRAAPTLELGHAVRFEGGVQLASGGPARGQALPQSLPGSAGWLLAAMGALQAAFLLLLGTAAALENGFTKPSLGFNTYAGWRAPWEPAKRPRAVSEKKQATPHGLPLPRSWNAFFKNIDEDLVKQQADLMVSLGLRDAGCAAAAACLRLPPAPCGRPPRSRSRLCLTSTLIHRPINPNQPTNQPTNESTVSSPWTPATSTWCWTTAGASGRAPPTAACAATPTDSPRA